MMACATSRSTGLSYIERNPVTTATEIQFDGSNVQHKEQKGDCITGHSAQGVSSPALVRVGAVQRSVSWLAKESSGDRTCASSSVR